MDAYGQGGAPMWRSRMAAVMQEVGYGCSTDAATFRGVLQSVQDTRLDEPTVAEVLAVMATTTPGTSAPGSPEQLASLSATLSIISNGGNGVLPDGTQFVGWAWRVVIEVLKQTAPALNWLVVAEQLDHPSFVPPSIEAFYLLAHAYRLGSGGEQLPVKALVGRWANELGQLACLKFAVVAPPEVFSFQGSERKVSPVEGLGGGKSPVGTPNWAWLSVDLLQIMCHFTVDASKRPTVLAMLEYPIKHCPEVLLITMAAVPEDKPILQREVYSILLPPYLKDPQYPNGQLVLHRLWAVNPKLVKEMLLEYYLHDREHLARIYDICHELQVLPEVLADTPSCRFALHLAVYAAQAKQSVNLEQWAAARLAREPLTLVHEVLLFLYAKVAAMQSGDATAAQQVLGRLSDETVHALLRVLLPLRAQMAGDALEAYHQLADLVGKSQPQLKLSMQAPLFSAEVDTEAKSYLQRLHSRSISWEEVFAHVQKLRASGNQRDLELFASFTHQLLSELPSYLYDEFKDLQPLVLLLSALLTQQVLSGLALGVALRFVLLALRQLPSTRPFAFGLAVLRQVVRAARPWPAFCEQVLLTPAVRDTAPEVWSRIEAALRECQVALMSGEPPPTQHAMLPVMNLALEAGQASTAAAQLPPPPGPPAPPPQQQQPMGPASPKAPGIAGTGAAAKPSSGTWGAATAAAGVTPRKPPGLPAPAGRPLGGYEGGGTPGGVGGASTLTGSLDKNRSVEGRDIETELESQLLAPNPPLAPQGGLTSARALGMANVNVVSLENASEKHDAPGEGVLDSISFIVNNLSSDNVDTRANDIKNKVVPNYRGWFCEYMAKRAAQEHNYQPLYLRLMDRMSDRLLFKQLVKSTYFYVRLLLTGDRAVRESNDRQLLKNLGHWLGHLTLKRHKPLLSKELELKQIVVEAYQRGRLVSVLPFIANLLSVCEKSLVFTPHNPMISGLLSLLAELHKLPQLKFNGQYCIEMVFKTFGNPVVEPTHLLVTLPRDTQNNADFSNVSEDTVAAGLMSAETTSHMQAMMNASQAARVFSQNVVGATAGMRGTPGKSPLGLPGVPPGVLTPPGVGNGTPGAAAAAAAAAVAGMISGGLPPGMVPGAASTQMLQGMLPGMGAAAAAAAAAAALTQQSAAAMMVGMMQQGSGAAGGDGAGASKQQQEMAMRAAAAAAAAAQQQQVPPPPPPGAPAGAAPPPPGLAQGALSQQVPQPTGLCLEHNAMISFLASNAVINPSLGAIAERLQLKRNVPVGVERAIWEILNPVVERSVTIACSTTVELLCKDFALDADEVRMRKAAHLMVSSLSGSLSLVTCKDPLRISLTNQLGQLMQAQAAAVGIDKTMLDQVATVVVQDNLEACCQVFERAATDKAVREVDKQLADKYEERAQCRKINRAFPGDSSAFHGRFPAQLPESLRPRPGVVSQVQLRVYEDFARVPRTPPPPPIATGIAGAGGLGVAAAGGMGGGGRAYGMGGEEAGKEAGAGLPPGGGGAGVVLEQSYLHWQGLADSALSKGEAGCDPIELQELMQQLLEFAAGVSVQHGEEAAALVLQHVFRHLFELPAAANSKLGATFFATALRHLVDAISLSKGPQAQALSTRLSALWSTSDDERKYALLSVEALLRLGLMQPPDLDAALSRAVGRSPGATELLAHLLKGMVLREQALSYADLTLSIDVLTKVAAQLRTAGTPAQVASAEQHLALAEQARRVLAPQRQPNELPASVRDKLDGAGIKEQALASFDEWLRLSSGSPGLLAYALNPHLGPTVSDQDRAALHGFLMGLRSSGALKDEPSSERWVRVCVELAVNHAQTVLEQSRGSPEAPHLLHMAVDGLARLLACITVHGARLPFLRSALGVVVGLVKRDADEQGTAFNGRPYLRLVVGLMSELPGGSAGNSAGAEALDPHALRYLRCIGEALHALQPLSVPGWAFCWLAAVAHRSFMPRLLLSPQQHGWVLYESLLVAQLRFLEPYLRGSSELSPCIRALYKGTLRLLLVLLHDFPEFLCEHHFSLCDAIPVSCVQLRNLVLSAFPRSMRLPDPFTPGLKVALLPEIMQPPRVLPEPDKLLDRLPGHEGLRAAIDSYLLSQQPASLPLDLARAFQQGSGSVVASPGQDAKGGASGGGAASGAYNVPLINAVVLYIGATSHTVTPVADGPAMEVFLRLMEQLDSEGRYLVLNAAANQLRYPNSHTYYFSYLLLTLFADTKAESVKEQITRVLLERLVVNRPHPWGLLVTFIELIKEPRYQFWTHEFTRNGADVERLFKSVSESCMAHGAVGGGAGAVAAAAGGGGSGGVLEGQRGGRGEGDEGGARG